MIYDGDENAGRAESRASTSGDVRPSDVTMVLHVEPDPRLREVLSAFLRRQSEAIAVGSAGCVADALPRVADADCIVTEHRLPDGTGIELLERARGRGWQTPFVFHTTCCDPPIENRAREAGVAAYIRKRPVRGQYNRLLGAIRDRLGVADSANEANRSTGSSAPEPASSSRSEGPTERF